MKTMFVKEAKILFEIEGFLKMAEGETVFIDHHWYKVINCSLHLPQKRLYIELF